MFTKNDRKILKMVKFQENIEKKLSEQELLFIDNILRVAEETNSDKKDNKENAQENAYKNQDLNYIMKNIMIDLYGSNQISLKMYILDLNVMLISITSIVSSIIAYEYNFPYFPPSSFSLQFYFENNIRGILILTHLCNTILTSLLKVILHYYRYILQIEFEVYNKNLNSEETLYTTRYYLYLLLEILISLPHPNLLCMNISYKYTFQSHENLAILTYYYNDFLIVMMLARIYYVIRFFLVSSYFKTARSYRICKLYGENASDLFAMRSLFNKYPITFFISSFIINVIVFAFAIRVFERVLKSSLCDIPLTSVQDFNLFENCLWYVVVTSLTIGYGEFTPKTVFGRVIGILLIFCGLLIVSIITVVFFKLMEFSPNEIKVYMLLERLKLREHIRATEREISRLAFKNFLFSWNIRKNHEVKDIEIWNEQRKRNKIKINFLIRKKNLIKKKIEYITNDNYMLEQILNEIQNVSTQITQNVNMFLSLSKKLNEINTTDKEMIKFIKKSVESKRRSQRNYYKNSAKTKRISTFSKITSSE